jgi:O-antigen/teichoic acid export membrane protein
MDPATAVYVLRVLGIASLLALPNSLYRSLFEGLQRMEFSNAIAVTIESLRRFGTIVILVLGGSLLHVIHWYSACYGLKLLIYLAISGRFFPMGAFIPGCSAEVIKRNIGFALKMASISITATIHTQLDKLILSKLMPIGILGYYSVAYKNTSKARQFMSAVSQAAFPSFSAISKAENQVKLMSQYRKLQDLLCFGIVLVFAAIPFAALPLFSYILNEEAARLLLLPTVLLCMGFYMNGTMTIPYAFSLAVGKPGIAARLNLYTLLVAPPVTSFLIYYLGLTGAGLAWVFSQILAYFYFVPRICRECMKISVWEWYLQVFKAIALAGSTYGIAWIILGMIGNYSILFLTTAYIGASVVFLIAAYFLISDELREMLLRILNRSGILRKLDGEVVR